VAWRCCVDAGSCCCVELKGLLVKILVAVDSSAAARKAVGFAANLARGASAEITLFHVVECLPDFLVQKAGGGGAFATVASEWAKSNAEAGERLLTEQRQALVGTGMATAKVHTRCCQRESRPEAKRVVAALAIIDEMKQGGYDVVVLGRRATASQNESLIGGVAEKVAREAHGKTVCIVDG
jgi:nucleotide-binding universal stress UspA family protein